MANKKELLGRLTALAENLDTQQLKMLLETATSMQTGKMASFAQFCEAMKDRGQNPKAARRLWIKLEYLCPTIPTHWGCLEADLPVSFLRSMERKLHNTSPQVWNAFLDWAKRLRG